MILLAVPVGMLLALRSSGVEPEIVGPFRPAVIPQRLRCSRVADRLRRHGGPVLVGGAEPPGHRQLPRQRVLFFVTVYVVDAAVTTFLLNAGHSARCWIHVGIIASSSDTGDMDTDREEYAL